MKATEFIEEYKNTDFKLSEEMKLNLQNDGLRDELYKLIPLKNVSSFHSLLQTLFDFELIYRLDEDNDDEFFENIYQCAFFLFKIGDLQDVLPMWKAKMSDFDLGCGFDIQFLVGAGVPSTIDYLEKSEDSEAKKALEYIQNCQEVGDFDNLEEWIKFRKGYFEIYS